MGPPLSTPTQYAQKTPLSIHLRFLPSSSSPLMMMEGRRCGLRNGGSVAPEGEEDSPLGSGERTPRSTGKRTTPRGSSVDGCSGGRLSRRMFASMERKMDRVINLLTPVRRGGGERGPGGITSLSNAKEGMVNISTTSASDPRLVLEELFRVFNAKGISCEQSGSALLPLPSHRGIAGWTWRWKIHGKSEGKAGRGRLTLELEVVWISHLGVVGTNSFPFSYLLIPTR